MPRKSYRSQNIVGPVFSDLLGIGFDCRHLVIATAFYSGAALRRLIGSPERLSIMCRISLREWENGLIDPPALLQTLRAYETQGTVVNLYVHERAHAKVYAGSSTALVGSANLTMQGFGGGLEIVRSVSGPKAIREIVSAACAYAQYLRPWTLERLTTFVVTNSTNVRRKHRRRVTGPPEDRLPLVKRDIITRLGSYKDFQRWLLRQPSSAAREIWRRSTGKHNLQGHISKNFYGLRQFFIANPQNLSAFATEDSDTYKLSRDSETEEKIGNFVAQHGVDEPDFELDIWKTYLPIECGGRADKHGGTIGNMNRMLPLVAQYLTAHLSDKK